jgi:hypothetical protein
MDSSLTSRLLGNQGIVVVPGERRRVWLALAGRARDESIDDQLDIVFVESSILAVVAGNRPHHDISTT